MGNKINFHLLEHKKMLLTDQRYESFLSNIRSNLLRHKEPMSHECLKYLADAARLHADLLPMHFYWVFKLFLVCVLCFLACVPSFSHGFILAVIRKLPGFCTFIYYHEKMSAAAELEFLQHQKLRASSYIKTEIQS